MNKYILVILSSALLSACGVNDGFDRLVNEGNSGGTFTEGEIPASDFRSFDTTDDGSEHLLVDDFNEQEKLCILAVKEQVKIYHASISTESDVSSVDVKAFYGDSEDVEGLDAEVYMVDGTEYWVEATRSNCGIEVIEKL